MRIPIAAAALAFPAVAQAQAAPSAPAPVAVQPAAPATRMVGEWYIADHQSFCTGIRVIEEGKRSVSLIYPGPGAPAPDLRFYVLDSDYFADAEDTKPYPARLLLTRNTEFDTRWERNNAVGVALKRGDKGIIVTGLDTGFADALAEADSVRVEVWGRHAHSTDLTGTRALVEALRKCAVPQ
jgi:hypothetical protein